MVRCLRSWHYIHQFSYFPSVPRVAACARIFLFAPVVGREQRWMSGARKQSLSPKFLTLAQVVGCVWGAGRKQHGTCWSRDSPGGEEGAGCFACCLPCDVGLWKKSVTEMKQAQNRDALGWSLSNQLHVKLSDFGDVPCPPIPTIFYSSLCDLQLCVHLPSLKCPFLV